MKEILESARRGDESSRDRLLELTRPAALRWARGLVADQSAAEDVAQEALLEVWRTLGSLREEGAYLAWVRLLVRKHADRHRRRLRPTLTLDLVLELADDGLGPADQAEASDQDQVVRRMLALVPDPDRRLLDLRYVESRTDADLAALLGISPGAVRKRLFDARKRLRPSLEASLDLPLEIRRPAMTPRFGLVTDVTSGRLPNREPVMDQTALVTGVRALDALLPWPRAGLIDLCGPVGTGQLVLLGEVLSGLHCNSPAALVGAQGTRPAADGSSTRLNRIVEDEAGQPAQSRIFRGDSEAALAAAAGFAGELAREGSTVLLVVDGTVFDDVGTEAVARLPLALSHGSVTVVRCAVWARDGEPAAPWAEAHTRVVLSAEQAIRGLYPAIDLLQSASSLADSTLAGAAREQLRRCRDLEQWVAQPFVSAQDFTGVPGVRSTPHEAITQLQATLG